MIANTNNLPKIIAAEIMHLIKILVLKPQKKTIFKS